MIYFFSKYLIFCEKKKSKDQKSFLGIALATYFLRLQIIILMRGKRSIKQENSNNLTQIVKIVTDLADAYENYTSDFSM